MNLSHGVPIATPVFDGANEEEIKHLLKMADLPGDRPDACCTTAARASGSTGR